MGRKLTEQVGPNILYPYFDVVRLLQHPLPQPHHALFPTIEALNQNVGSIAAY